jgi:hypothetical protein
MNKSSNLEDYRTPFPAHLKVINTRKYQYVRELENLHHKRLNVSATLLSSLIIMIAYHHALRVSELVTSGLVTRSDSCEPIKEWCRQCAPIERSEHPCITQIETRLL